MPTRGSGTFFGGIMETTIREVLAAHGRLAADASSIGTTADLYQAGLTSHASVNVMLALEDEFDVEFRDEDLTKSTFSSIDSISTVLGSLVRV